MCHVAGETPEASIRGRLVREDFGMPIGVVELSRRGANISRRLMRAGRGLARGYETLPSAMRFGFGGHVEAGKA